MQVAWHQVFFKSGNVIELLKQLKAKFDFDKLDAIKAETYAQTAHASAGDVPKNAADAAQFSQESKANPLAHVEDKPNVAKANLKNLRQLCESDTATLEETQKSCAMKATEQAVVKPSLQQTIRFHPCRLRQKNPGSLLQVGDPKTKADKEDKIEALITKIDSKALELAQMMATNKVVTEIARHLHLNPANISATANSLAATRLDLEAWGDCESHGNRYSPDSGNVIGLLDS